MWIFDKLFHSKKEVPRIDITKRFDLLNRIGQGTMSRVWKATDTSSGKTVCIKVLDKDKLELLNTKFKNLEKPSEGEIAVLFDHPHIVKTFEYGYTTEDEQFLVMEYIDGAGLSVYVELQDEVMKKNRLKWMIQSGEALNYIHRKGFIHRDMCPHNLMVNRNYDIKLLDFGLTVPDKPEFKQPGNRTGKAGYMAPELMKRQKTDIRLDVFSYGITCYEMWTKNFPYEGGTSAQKLFQSYSRPPVQITEFNSEISAPVAEIIMKAIEVDPAKRWGSMNEIISQLKKLA